MQDLMICPDCDGRCGIDRPCFLCEDSGVVSAARVARVSNAEQDALIEASLAPNDYRPAYDLPESEIPF